MNRLFVLAINNTENGNNKVERDSHRKCFLSRVNITNYNVLIDSRNFYDQPINDQIKKYNEIRKTARGKGDNYATGCLLDYQYLKDHYQLIAGDLSKQKVLDANPRASQQTEFYGKFTSVHSLRKIKRNCIRIFQTNSKSVVRTYKWLNTTQ